MSSWIKSSRCYNNCFRNAAPRMPKKADVQSFWKTSHRFAVNNPDKRGHQYAPFHTRSLNAKLLGLSSNRRARNPYAAQNLCFKGSSATCIKVCTSDLLTEGIPLVGMETLVGWITLQHEEGHQSSMGTAQGRAPHLGIWQRVSYQTEGLSFMPEAEEHSFQPPGVGGLVLMVASVRNLVKRLHM